MKIGLLSFPYGSNYGAVLQVYALKSIIETLPDVESVYVIKREADLGNFFLKRFYSAIKKKYYSFFESNFNHFRKNHFINQTDLINTQKKVELLEKYDFDAVIVGSDQVWRYNYSKDFGYNLFLDFVAASTKKIAYAASFGTDKWNECSDFETIKIKQLIQRFDAISVRENTGIDLCKKVFDVEALHLLDPTIIADKSIYENLLLNSNIQDNFKGSIATYILDDSKDKSRIINDVSQRMNIPTRNIYLKNHPKNLFKLKSFSIKDFIYPSIQFWLKGIKESDFVITDSFHGTIFSIIFRKKFIVVSNKERGISRIQSILSTFSLENRLVFSLDDLNDQILNSIDYSGIDDKIYNEQVKSKFFLTKSLDLKKLKYIDGK